MSKERINIENLSIHFRYPIDQTLTIRAKLIEIYRKTLKKEKTRYFQALSNISIKFYDGDVVGIIGPNGSGKTTLLRAISSIYYPDTGIVRCNGKISTLLSLGTGFDNNLSGIDNIRLNGLLMGMSIDQIEKKIPTIIEFTDIGDHIYGPMKYYSNGMISRLSFSIVLSMQPDILLIDEVFSVGDLAFQKKSRAAMRNMLDKASCQIIVTHSMGLVKEYCNRAVLMNKGCIVMDGSPNEIVSKYEASIK